MQEISKHFSVKEFFAQIKPANNTTKLLSIGFGILLIGWLLSQLEWAATVDVLRNVPVSLLVLGFVCYAITFYLRAVRFQLLLPSKTQAKHMFPIVLVHYTALNIIPARLGELSYVYLLKRVNNVSTGYSVSSLVIARVFDQIAISVLFLCSSALVSHPTTWLKRLNWTVGGGLIAIFILLMLLLAYKEQTVHLIKILLIRCHWEQHPFAQRLLKVLDEIIAACKHLQITKNLEKVIGISLLIWLGIFSVNYLLLTAFEVHLSFIEIILASTFIILLTVLPVQFLNGLGIHETTWTFIAVALGVPKQIAIVSAFGTHILSTVFLLIFAIYGLWRISAVTRHQNEASDSHEHGNTTHLME